jgi:hypothetical protein
VDVEEPGTRSAVDHVGQSIVVVRERMPLRDAIRDVDIDERGADVHPAIGPDAHEPVVPLRVEDLTLVGAGATAQAQNHERCMNHPTPI